MSDCEIVIDIETIPSQLPWVKEYIEKKVAQPKFIAPPEEPTPPKNMKKQETIDKWYAEDFERIKAEQKAVYDEALSQEESKYQATLKKAYEKCALDGAMNHIICIGVAIDDAAPVSLSIHSHEQERDNLRRFYDYLQEHCGDYAHTWIGHNISGFDFKILRQRSIVLGVQWPVFLQRAFQDKWGDAVYDTMLRWSNDRRDYISLDKLCHVFGIESSKQNMHGDEVYKYWLEGKYQEIANYCIGDVDKTRAVYRNMTMSV